MKKRLSSAIVILALGHSLAIENASAQNCRFLLDGCDQRSPPEIPAGPPPPPEKDSMQELVECCLAYCRVVNCNSPPATTGCSPSFIKSALVKYADSYRSYGGTAAYGWKRMYLDGAKSAGVTLRACQ
jgi:hypothetical protein